MAVRKSNRQKTRGDKHNTAEGMELNGVWLRSYEAGTRSEVEWMKLYCGCDSPAERRKRACGDEGEEA